MSKTVTTPCFNLYSVDYSTTANRGAVLLQPLDSFSAYFSQGWLPKFHFLTNVVIMCRDIIYVWGTAVLQQLNIVVAGIGIDMTKEFTKRHNDIGHIMSAGDWQKAIREMVKDGMTTEDMRWFCDQINFYPNSNFWDYARNMIAARKNKEALDGFFGFAN